MTKKIVYIVLLTVLLSGCMSLHLRDNVNYPEQTFERAEKKIEDLHAKDPQRRGKIHKLNLLVYDGENRELVKLSIRKWLAQLILKIAVKDDMEDNVTNAILKDIKNLKKIGPGLLVEVKEEKENSHILMWID